MRKAFKASVYVRILVGIILVSVLFLLNSKKEGFQTTNSFTYVFICHREYDAKKLLEKYPGCTILFVGSASVKQDPRIIIARDLPYNIESEKKLLTFTAWYAISKNNLFKDSEYIGLFEYDVVLDDTFNQVIQNELNNNYDVITFNSINIHFLTDIVKSVLNSFLNVKKVISHPFDKDTLWYGSTNHILRRDLLDTFVDWYYPDCMMIKKLDPEHLSYYHERLFSVYAIHNGLNIKVLNGILTHLQNYSHNGGYKNV